MISITKKFIITASSDKLEYGNGEKLVEKIGLIGRHAYSILGVYEIIKTENGYKTIDIIERKCQNHTLLTFPTPPNLDRRSKIKHDN